MTDFEKRKIALKNAEGVECFEGYDLERKIDCLVISYWESHTHIEEIFDMNENYIATDEENDWDNL